MTEDEIAIRRYWISLGILALSIFVWWVVKLERDSAEFRSDKYAECVQEFSGHEEFCTKWKSEWER
jgi:hypothetical protein